VHTAAETAVGLGWLQPLLDPKKPWSPLKPPSIFEKKRRRRRKKEGRVEEISPALINSRFATVCIPITPIPLISPHVAIIPAK